MASELQRARVDDSIFRTRQLFPIDAAEGAASASSTQHHSSASTQIKRVAKEAANFKSMKPEKEYASWKAAASSSSSSNEGQAKMLTYEQQLLIDNGNGDDNTSAAASSATALVVKGQSAAEADFERLMPQSLVARRAPPKIPTPVWHAPWELAAVISGTMHRHAYTYIYIHIHTHTQNRKKPA